MELQLTGLPEFITFKTNCELDPKNCVITQQNPTVHVKAEITAMDCTQSSHFEINPFGLSNEKLSININVNCKCQCEDISTVVSKDCSDAGVKECGICKCPSNRYLYILSKHC